MMYFLLIIGFVLLIKGADFFVDGSVYLAKYFNIPTVIIGLTIVAFGTSLPEAAVSVTSAIKGSNALAFSNVVGSNIFNLLAIIGVSSLIKPVVVDKGIIKRDFPFSIIIVGLVLVLSVDMLQSRLDGVILLVIFAAYMTYLIIHTIKAPEEAGSCSDVESFGNSETDTSKIKTKEKFRPINIVMIIGGLAAIVLGGDMVVDNACEIAESFGFSKMFIGLTIVAVGTSLPELVTSLVASKKGENSIAVGNVIGSNIFNLLFILGLSCVISPISILKESIIDVAFLLASSILMYLFCIKNRKYLRPFAVAALAMYIGYMIYIGLR